MKKLIIMSALVMGGLGINNASAQLGIRVNLHFGTGPVYVPAPRPVEVVEQPVYDDDYYYLPEVEAYYSVGEHCYYYQDGENWVSAAYLPGMYRDFDWRTAKHYEVRTSRPYMHNDVYRAKFGGFNRNEYYTRAYPNREYYNNHSYRERPQYDNRGRNDNRGGFDRGNDRNQNAYNQPAYNRSQGGYNQPSQNQGSYNKPSQDRNQGGYSQPAQPAQPAQQQGGFNRGQGGNNNMPAQPAQQQGGFNRGQGGNNNSQPSQGQSQQGGRNNGQGGSNSQPSTRNGGNAGGGQYAANKMGVVQDRAEFARPIRNN